MNADSFKEPAILYVDDQPSHLALFKKAFQGDYLVLTASSGEEGLEIIKDHEISLIIADHNMPRMTGVDFLSKARGIAPRAVPAILSAYLNEEIVREAREKVQIFGHLPKPWKLDQMRDFIEGAIKIYEGGIPQGEIKEEPTLQERWIGSAEISRFVETLEERVDKRGARRVFLSYVEPPLKKFVPIIHRPAPPLLSQAQTAALKGNFEAVQKILVNYLRENCLADLSEKESKR